MNYAPLGLAPVGAPSPQGLMEENKMPQKEVGAGNALDNDWITEALQGDLTPEEKARRYKLVSERRAKLKKIEKRLKKEIAGETDKLHRLQGGKFGQGEHDLGDGLIMKVSVVSPTRLKESKASEYLEKQGLLEDFQYTYSYPTIAFEDLSLE